MYKFSYSTAEVAFTIALFILILAVIISGVSLLARSIQNYNWAKYVKFKDEVIFYRRGIIILSFITALLIAGETCLFIRLVNILHEYKFPLLL